MPTRLDIRRSLAAVRNRRWLIQYFNPKAFAVNALGTFGTTGRDILRGPGTQTFDWSLFKNVTVREGQTLQFRAEFFDLFNHPNFAQPVATVANPNFGKILSANSTRIIQFALKYVF